MTQRQRPDRRGRGWYGARAWSRRGPRPPWWPENEAWPSSRRSRGWRGFGCLFGLVFVVGFLGLASLASHLIGGILDARGPIGTLARVAAIVVAVAILASFVRGGRALRNSGAVLDELVDVASRVEAGDYTARVRQPAHGPRPVRDLVRAFDTMAARLQTDEDQRRSLLADVTHELRTPLAVVQGNLEAIIDGVHPADEAHLSSILDETRVLTRLIEDLRTLALSEAGSLSLHREPTDLAILAADVAAAFEIAARTAGIEIEADVEESLPLLDIDPVRIREVIGNLVANAIRHTPAGGTIRISGTVDDGSVELVVADSGSGIEPDLLPHVFERFTRSSSTGGSGLGLAIARGLVELHGGTIAAVSPPGGGTRIEVRLPIRGSA
ncbi:MAG TPA: ATP-binding protein [Candidatus Limnocylindrales bacterium]|nr:ATP-binding protein [Candidatus Limnocylindrales bacterium]